MSGVAAAQGLGSAPDAALVGTAAKWLVAGTVYTLAAWAGLHMAVSPETVSPVWPATGVAIAALSIVGLRAWPVIAVGAFLVELPALGIAGALLASAGNSLEAVVGAWGLRRLGGAAAFATGGGVTRFLAVVALAPLPSAAAGTIAVARLAGPTPLAEVAVTWYLGNAMGALLVTPALVLAFQPAGLAGRARELAAYVCASVAIAIVAFYPWRGEGLDEIRLGFLAVAPIAWAATRFGPLITAWTAMGMAAAAIAGLAAGTVPLLGSANAVLLQLQALTGLVTVLGLLLAANVQERNDTIGLLQRREADIRQALAALQRGDRVKTMFLRKAAHEMRTPLTPLRLQAHLLAQGPMTPKQAHAMQLVARSVTRLERLVDGLLEAARMESARLALTRTDVESAAVVQDAVAQARPTAEQARITLVGDADGSHLYGDRAAIGRALWHLLANGIRHTPAGGMVRIEAVQDGEQVRITVTDGGHGVPMADREGLFEPFSEANAISGGEGPGLGLFIVKSLVDAHDGTVTVEGEEGEGARFVVRLPGG